MEAISFRPMTRADLPIVHEWLNREHVRRWWRDSGRLEHVEARYGPAIDGDEPTQMFVIEIDGRPAGTIQTYLLSDYPDWIGDEPGVAGVDLFIAVEELTGRGLGTRILTGFVRDVVFASPAVTACVASLNVRNHQSRRAFDKAGFSPVREILDEGHLELLMRKERA